jgi:L-fucose isomerase-like protein
MPGIRFEGGELYRIPQDVPTSAAAFGNPDGFLIFNLTSTLSSHIERIAGIGMPAILYSQPYSGHDWSSVAGMQKKGHRIVCLSTSDFNEIPGACRLIRTAHLMRATRILYVNTSPYNAEAVSRIKERLGSEVIHITPEQVIAAYQAVDESAARADARTWISGAMRVVEPTEQEVGKSSRLYLALRGLMQEQRAQAVTINCLGLFNQKKLPAYPCLAFCKMNDLGLVGVCEGDVDSTLTQLIFAYAFGIPGYVSDPVIDTSSNTVIHAHCVSATKLDGPAGAAAPYIIRSHMEDNKGASLQVKMRVGQIITMAKLIRHETMLISTGTITGNPESDRGCRTKISTKVADAHKLLEGYQGGLHRVIFYGDRVRAIKDLSGLMQFKVFQEG